MTDGFERRTARARDLSTKFPESAKLLEFYGELIALQKSIFANLRERTELGHLATYFPALVELVKSAGAEPLIAFAHGDLRTPEAREELLEAFWNRTREMAGPAQFFARVVIQPYAEYLAKRVTTDAVAFESTCPFCSSRPVAGVLRGEGDGGKRSLLCSLCSLEWPYRRILCPSCGEEQKDKLPVYIAAECDHVRVEACDTCRTYLKSVDLTKQGFAVPEVDELATVALGLWAEENGYTKVETNLLGM